MTDRYTGFIVILEHDIRDDDAQSTIQAIRHIKGVLDVTPVVADPMIAIAEMRAKIDLRQKIITLLNGEIK